MLNRGGVAKCVLGLRSGLLKNIMSHTDMNTVPVDIPQAPLCFQLFGTTGGDPKPKTLGHRASEPFSPIACTIALQILVPQTQSVAV